MGYDPRAVLLKKSDKLALSRIIDSNRLRGSYRSLAQAVTANLRNRARGNRKEGTE